MLLEVLRGHLQIILGRQMEGAFSILAPSSSLVEGRVPSLEGCQDTLYIPDQDEPGERSTSAYIQVPVRGPNTVPCAQPAPEPGCAAKKRGRPRKGKSEQPDLTDHARQTRLTNVLIGARLLKGEADAGRWLTLVLPDGTKVPPHAVGIRKDPADPSGQSTVGSPLYFAREIYEHVVDDSMQRSSKWKKWQRLWKLSSGHDGPLVDHAIFIQEDGSCAAATGPRQDSLVGLNGLEVLIDAAASDDLTERPRDCFFFETPLPEPLRAMAQPSSSRAPPPPQATPAATEDLMRQAIHLLTSAMEKGASQATIQHMILELRLPPERAASLGEVASLLHSQVAARLALVHLPLESSLN